MRNESAYLLGRRRTLIVLSGLMLGMLLAALNQELGAEFDEPEAAAVAR